MLIPNSSLFLRHKHPYSFTNCPLDFHCGIEYSLVSNYTGKVVAKLQPVCSVSLDFHCGIEHSLVSDSTGKAVAKLQRGYNVQERMQSMQFKDKETKKDSIYLNFLNTTAKYMFLLNLESALCSIYSQIVLV